MMINFSNLLMKEPVMPQPTCSFTRYDNISSNLGIAKHNLFCKLCHQSLGTSELISPCLLFKVLEYIEDKITRKYPRMHQFLLSILLQDEFGERPRISNVLNSISNYSSTIQTAPDDPNAPKAPEKANLGTLMGVYLPCLQNIFGVILFIRMTWLVGTCGAIEGFLVILICCCTVSISQIFF